MRKLDKLKSWYSLADAAKRLTLSLGEEISSSDMIELALEGQIELFWHLRHVDAQEVEFGMRKLRVPETEEWEFGSKLSDLNSKIVEIPGIYPVEGQPEVTKLFGPHRLLLKACPALADHFRSYLTGTASDLTSLDGFYIQDSDKKVWQTLEMFDGDDIEKWYGPDIGLFDRRRFFPSVNWPEVSEVGFTREEIELFEASLNANASGEVQNRERGTLLKLIIGMAVDGYGYKPSSAKSPFPKELEGILDRLGISVSNDTIRSKLKEAAQLLPSGEVD